MQTISKRFRVLFLQRRCENWHCQGSLFFTEKTNAMSIKKQKVVFLVKSLNSTVSKKDKDVIFINYNTNVEEAGETSVDFSLASAGQNRQEQSAKQVKVNIKQCYSSIF